MQNITNTKELKQAIQLLEEEQSLKTQALKDQFFITYEGLKPINILKNTVNDIVSTPLLLDNLISTATGMVTGYISKKVLVGSKGGAFRKLIGSFVQFGVSNMVSKYPDAIKSAGLYVFNSIFSKKTESSEDGESI